MNDICVIGCVGGYSYDKIKTWVDSLLESGFSGEKIILAYELSKETIEILETNGFKVIVHERDITMHVATQRYIDTQKIIDGGTIQSELVLITDTRDVIFQRNPEEWLLEKQIQKNSIIASSEGITYRHEDWNADHLELSFGTNLLNKYIDKVVFNSGIIFGPKNEVSKLLEATIEYGKVAKNTNSFLDQIYYNVALHEVFFDSEISNTIQLEHDSGWACQSACMIALPRENQMWGVNEVSHFTNRLRDRKGVQNFSQALIEQIPIVNAGKAYTSRGELFCLLHQYDRVGELAKESPAQYDKNHPIKKYLNNYLGDLYVEGGNKGTVVVIEPLQNPNLLPTLKSTMSKLGSGWNLIVYIGYDKILGGNITGPGARVIQKEMLRNLSGYSLELMNLNMWQSIDTKNVLVTQSDAILLNTGIDNYLGKYDYIGAPYRYTTKDGTELLSPIGMDFNLNGGFSLRNRDVMIKALNEFDWRNPEKLFSDNGRDDMLKMFSEWPIEDVFYLHALHKMGASMPKEWSEASSFCHTVPQNGQTMAIHAFDKIKYGWNLEALKLYLH